MKLKLKIKYVMEIIFLMISLNVNLFAKNIKSKYLKIEDLGIKVLMI